jgi:diguanylate cyclase (GGDEF)-like protein
MIVVLAYVTPSDDLHLYEGNIYELSDGWEVNLPDETFHEVSIPASYEVAVNTVYTISRIFEEDFPQNSSIRISANMQDIAVYVDQQLIFENEKLDKGLLHSPLALAWYVIELPENVQGKSLEISMSSPVSFFSGTVSSIYYGSSDELKFDIISRQPMGIIIGFCILIFGIIILLGTMLLKNISDKRGFYLGSFLITSSIWLISEMDLLQFFTGNRFIIGGISYIMIPLSCSFFILYMNEVALSRYRKFLNILSSIYVVMLCMNMVLQLGGLEYLINSIVVVDIFVLITLMIVFSLLIIEVVKYQSKVAGRYIWYFSVLLISLFIEVIIFLKQDIEGISSVTRIGFGVFFIFLVIESVQHLNNLILTETENNILRQIAYKDILTGGYNRSAYERDINQLLRDTSRPSFRLVMMDINNLKRINDTYGHLKGDKLIRDYYKIMEDIFLNIGKCYRLGGDEFAIIVNDTDISRYGAAIKSLESCLDKYNNNSSYSVNIAIGTGVFENDNTEPFHEFMHKVDVKMYEDKKQKKIMENK